MPSPRGRSVPPTSPGSVRFTSYNLLDLFGGDTGHYETIVAVIRSLGTDMLAVQEILAPDADTAARRLRRHPVAPNQSTRVPSPVQCRVPTPHVVTHSVPAM